MNTIKPHGNIYRCTKYVYIALQCSLFEVVQWFETVSKFEPIYKTETGDLILFISVWKYEHYLFISQYWNEIADK